MKTWTESSFLNAVFEIKDTTNDNVQNSDELYEYITFPKLYNNCPVFLVTSETFESRLFGKGRRNSSKSLIIPDALIWHHFRGRQVSLPHPLQSSQTYRSCYCHRICEKQWSYFNQSLK
jgi:hypothetical protein